MKIFTQTILIFKCKHYRRILVFWFGIFFIELSRHFISSFVIVEHVFAVTKYFPGTNQHFQCILNIADISYNRTPVHCSYPEFNCPADYKILHSHRSEEHTSELQSLRHLVCRLLLEKKQIQTAYSPSLLVAREHTDPETPHARF